ncbi:MAG: putative LPS assembly protein LptD [Rhodothermales bacterium]
MNIPIPPEFERYRALGREQHIPLSFVLVSPFVQDFQKPRLHEPANRILQRGLSAILAIFCFSFVLPQVAFSQETDTLKIEVPRPDSLRTDSLSLRPPLDSLPPGSMAPDSLAQNPTQQQISNPTSGQASSDLKNAVKFAARDSLIIKLNQDTGDTGAMYGTVQVDYGETKLNAQRVQILFDIDELRAQGVPSDTGLVGRPEFNQGEETFRGDAMAYNLRSERGRVTGAETRFDDGQIKGGVVKVREDSTLFIRNGVYTTCDCLDDPSYSLRSNKMKVVDQTQIFTGPIQLFLFNIPTPLWLPFGFLPAQNTRRSGFLAPTYGEDEFGFYLRDLGWYLALNDYMDLQLRGGFWTNGSWQGSTTWRYNKRYKYSGNVYFDYSRLRNGEKNDAGFAIRNAASFKLQHNQTIDPSTSLSSNINLSTQGYNREISDQYDERVTQSISSSVRFNKRWASTGRSLSFNANQNQVFSNNTTRMTLPNLTFSQSSRKPFKREVRAPGAKEQWFEKVTYTYNFSMNNTYNFRPIQDEAVLDSLGAADISWFDALLSQDKYELATGDDEPFDFRATHRIPISASFSAKRISLNITPNINYTEDWFLRTERQDQIFDSADSTFSVEQFSDRGFFALRQFSSGVSANTTIYGLFPFRLGEIQGIRHTLRPTLAFTYRPDFSGSFWGYTRSYVDEQTEEEIEYNIVNNVQRGLQQALSLSLSNIFEAKRVWTDSTGTEQDKVLKLLNLDASTRFNFAADSLKLSDIALSARTTLFNNKMSINFRSSFSPYNTFTDSTRTFVVDDYFLDLSKLRFGRLTRASLTASTSFKSKGGSAGRPVESTRSRPGDLNGIGSPGFNPDAAIANSFSNPTGDLVDFNIPWSLSLDFTYSIQKPLASLTRTMTLNGRFDFSLTPNWKIQGRTGYDFERKEVVTTNISFFRDFECWQMSLNWVPFGRYQSYGFNLQVKSGHLKDLLRIRQPRSDVQGRFDGLI